MKLARLLPAVAIVGVIITACGGSNNPTTTTSTVPSDLSISSFDANFTYMSKLTDLTKAGKGMVGVILRETSTSARYVDYDQPYLKKAFEAAGYTSSQYKIDNAQGSVQSEVAIAQADITAGATVLLMDPTDGPTGQQIQSLAASKGVKVISYDRATFQGTNTYYVSFDNVQVGKLIGKGFMDCVTAWKVSSPKVFTLDGGANTIPTTGQDATLQGMANVLQGFQCGSVYKPIYLEAQAAVALATVLRAGATPPTALVNGTTKPPSGQTGSEEPASLLVPIWVDKSNMAATVIKDNFVKASALCGQVGAAVCTANNIPTS